MDAQVEAIFDGSRALLTLPDRVVQIQGGWIEVRRKSSRSDEDGFLLANYPSSAVDHVRTDGDQMSIHMHGVSPLLVGAAEAPRMAQVAASLGRLLQSPVYASKGRTAQRVPSEVTLLDAQVPQPKTDPIDAPTRRIELSEVPGAEACLVRYELGGPQDPAEVTRTRSEPLADELVAPDPEAGTDVPQPWVSTPKTSDTLDDDWREEPTEFGRPFDSEAAEPTGEAPRVELEPAPGAKTFEATSSVDAGVFRQLLTDSAGAGDRRYLVQRLASLAEALPAASVDPELHSME